MSQFRDTFTKEQKKEPLLHYDDSAFFYFAGTLLLVIIVPWTYNFLYKCIYPSHVYSKVYPEKTQEGSLYKYCQCSHCVMKINTKKQEMKKLSHRLFNISTLAQLGVLSLLYALFLWLCYSLKDFKNIQSFNPYEILDLVSGEGSTADVSMKDIKKAYRVMSLKYHPDRNSNDPSAAAKFIMITKAYQALTDETSKANYLKYGNPDGPGVMKVGIGLPRFLIEEEFQLIILIAFFVILLVVIPMAFICYYQKQKKFAPNGVRVETLQFMSYYINDGTRLKHCPEYLAASSESRELDIRPADDGEMRPIIDEVVEPRKRQFNMPIIVRNYYLILAHMQRLHELMSPTLMDDLRKILKSSMLITQSMVEIASLRDWLLTAQATLDFRKFILQGLDMRCSSLLQIPHFDAEVLKHCHKGKHAVKELVDFLRQSPEERKGLTKMDPQQLADVQAFCGHVSDMKVQAVVEVEDEKEICVGDVASCHVKLTRLNLKDGEAVGPIHAPLFPETKYEEWWLLLSDKADGHLLAFACCTSREREFTERMQFRVDRAGRRNLCLNAICDSYAGIDVTLDIEYKAFAENEVNREVYVHPEDEALDNEPTLFQQMLGQLEGAESSDEEVDENSNAKQSASLADTKQSSEFEDDSNDED